MIEILNLLWVCDINKHPPKKISEKEEIEALKVRIEGDVWNKDLPEIKTKLQRR